MHTYATDDGWRIHHNGGFAGDIIIVSKTGDTTWDEHRTDSDRILAIVKRDVIHEGVSEPHYRLPARTQDDRPAEIDVPLSLLRSFVADRYVRRGLVELLEGADDDVLMGLLPVLESRQGG